MQIICFHNPYEENGYLSNWYPVQFSVDGIDFSSMEQFMMYRKAQCFQDNGVRQIVVYEGLLAKFSQNHDLKEKLIGTDNAILVECAVKDQIWGIGLSMKDENRFNRSKWRGQNLLGYALMMVRDQL